jgi:hypothetical protein
MGLVVLYLLVVVSWLLEFGFAFLALWRQERKIPSLVGATMAHKLGQPDGDTQTDTQRPS